MSDAAAGALYATDFGAPLATAVLAAGNTAHQVGGRVKDAGQRARAGIQQKNNFKIWTAGSSKSISARASYPMTDKAASTATNFSTESEGSTTREPSHQWCQQRNSIGY